MEPCKYEQKIAEHGEDIAVIKSWMEDQKSMQSQIRMQVIGTIINIVITGAVLAYVVLGHR